MFTNLNFFSGPSFEDHNFSVYDSELIKDPDPYGDVQVGFRSPDLLVPGLVETLSFTLSPACCASFLRANSALPIADRDYYLSKLFQFLHFTFLDESSDDKDYWNSVRPDLEALLDAAFPVHFNGWDALSRLNWSKLFKDYSSRDWKVLIENIADYLPQAEQAFRKRRGPPKKFTDEQIRKANDAKARGEGNRACARIIYQTLYPSKQQVKNIPKILSHRTPLLKAE